MRILPNQKINLSLKIKQRFTGGNTVEVVAGGLGPSSQSWLSLALLMFPKSGAGREEEVKGAILTS